MFYVEIIILIRSQSPHEHRNLDRIVGLTRVILSNPKGELWGSVQIGNLFLMSLLIPGPANGVAYPRLMVVFTHRPSLLKDFAGLLGLIGMSKSFSMIHAIIEMPIAVLILEFQKSSVLPNQVRRDRFRSALFRASTSFKSSAQTYRKPNYFPPH